MLLISIVLGLLLGTYLGKLITQYTFNNGVSPLKATEEVTDYDIHKEFDEDK